MDEILTYQNKYNLRHHLHACGCAIVCAVCTYVCSRVHVCVKHTQSRFRPSIMLVLGMELRSLGLIAGAVIQ